MGQSSTRVGELWVVTKRLRNPHEQFLEVAPTTEEERQAALVMTGIAIERGDLCGLEQVLRALGIKKDDDEEIST